MWNLNQSQRLIEYIEKDVKEIYNLERISVGWELEFYFENEPSDQLLKDIQLIDGIFEIKKELGNLQYEITTKPCTDLVKSCFEMNNIRNKITQIAKKYNNSIIYNAIINEHQPPSALQISFCFIKNNKFFEKSQLLPIVYNILSVIDEIIYIACPTPNCLERITNFNFVEKFKNSPTHTTWGVENRTVAIRLAKTKEGETRLEFRVASSVSDPYNLTIVLLASMLTTSNNIFPQTFCDSIHSDAKKLVKNIFDVEKLFFTGSVYKKIEQYCYAI